MKTVEFSHVNMDSHKGIDSRKDGCVCYKQQVNDIIFKIGKKKKKKYFFFFFTQKTAYEIVSRDWSSDVCSSDLFQWKQKLCYQTMKGNVCRVKPGQNGIVVHVYIVMLLGISLE